jgi:hypothetical protein
MQLRSLIHQQGYLCDEQQFSGGEVHSSESSGDAQFTRIERLIQISE